MKKKLIECRFDSGTAKPKFRVHMLLAHLESGQNAPESRLDRFLSLYIDLLYYLELHVVQVLSFSSFFLFYASLVKSLQNIRECHGFYTLENNKNN